MFIGHLALGMAAKRASPDTPLGWFVGAAVTLDILWPLFLLTGIEHVRIVPGATAFEPLVFDSYPWSHSLLMSMVWGAALALLARAAGVPVRGQWLVGALVVSHWLLDFASHAPDMPLWPGTTPLLGLGLWNSIPATFLVEGLLWVAGIVLYLKARPRTDRGATLVLWSFIAICTLMWAAGPFSTPPPSARFLAWFAIFGWIVVPWSWLADRARATRG